MFVLDTNVLSALMGVIPEPHVTTWLAAQSAKQLFTTAVSQAEINAGLSIMPPGRRRRDLECAAQRMFDQVFDGRVVAFTTEVAPHYGAIFSMRRQAGRPISTADLMIVAIARSRGASVVTRDVRGFEGCEVPLINPWDEGEGTAGNKSR